MQAHKGWQKANGVESKSTAPSDAEFEAAVRAGV
jgi:hypothetical protein